MDKIDWEFEFSHASIYEVLEDGINEGSFETKFVNEIANIVHN